MLRKYFLFVFFAVFLAVAPAFAGWQPGKPVTMMVMFPPGGGGDVFARAIAAHIEKALGWKIVVENRRGGGGAAMAKLLKDAPADGYTIGMAVTETYGFTPTLNPNIGYTDSDFKHLGALADTQIGWVVKADAPWNDLNELVEAAKKGEEIQVGTFSPRSNAAIHAVAKHFGIDLVPVLVKGGKAGIQNVMNGHLHSTLAAGPQAPLVRKGQMKVLASAEKDRLLVGKDALTFEEYGIGLASLTTKWVLSAPKALPNEIAKAYESALIRVTESAEMRTFIEEKLSLKMAFTSGAELHKLIADEQEKNLKLIGFLKD